MRVFPALPGRADSPCIHSLLLRAAPLPFPCIPQGAHCPAPCPFPPCRAPCAPLRTRDPTGAPPCPASRRPHGQTVPTASRPGPSLPRVHHVSLCDSRPAHARSLPCLSRFPRVTCLPALPPLPSHPTPTPRPLTPLSAHCTVLCNVGALLLLASNRVVGAKPARTGVGHSASMTGHAYNAADTTSDHASGPPHMGQN